MMKFLYYNNSKKYHLYASIGPSSVERRRCNVKFQTPNAEYRMMIFKKEAGGAQSGVGILFFFRFRFSDEITATPQGQTTPS